MEDKSELFREPLHGIYIPVALMIVGTLIFGVQYLPYTIAFIVVVLSVQFYLAKLRQGSLDPYKWNDLELLDKTIVSRNTAIYRFKLKHENETLDIPTGHHVACCMTIDGKDEIRYYSPISNNFDQGFMDIMVKAYPNGKVSKRLAMMEEGLFVKFRGPVGRLEYRTNLSKEIGLIAGGSGITPILQVLTRVITTPEDFTKLTLIFANETLNDVLLKDELDEISKKYPNFDVHYTLTHPPPGWKGLKGFVDSDMFKAHMPPPLPQNRLFICGPPEMRLAVLDIASEAGWSKGVLKSEPNDQVFCF